MKDRELLSERWWRLAEGNPEALAITHWVAGEEPYRWRRGALMNAAAGYAAHLLERGVQSGDVCAIIIRHHRELYPIYMAVSLIGALPAVLAYPNPRLHPLKFRDGLIGMSQRSGLDWLLAERTLEPVVRPLLETDENTIRDLLFPLEWTVGGGGTPPHQPAGRQRSVDPCLLQHSSGTTGLQKPVTLSHEAVLEHVRRYGESIALSASDRVVSWLPLYHDMGLIAALHLPLAAGIPVVQLDPFEWIIAPVILLDAIHQERGTLCWLPNFAYNLLADRSPDEELEEIRLDSMRLFVNCSEPVRAESHERFLSRFERYGVRAESLSACYAMAETTFAATQTRPGRAARVLDVARDELSRGRFRPATAGEARRRCVSSGVPIGGCDVEVVDEDRQPLPEGHVGELRIRSVSMFDGYRNYPEKTADVLEDGWYYSGDYGFLHEGECFVIGRKKDVIIVAGKNIYPEDVEDAVSRVEGILPGRVVAFGVDDTTLGTEQIAVVGETDRTGEDALSVLRRHVIEAAVQLDITISRVYLVPPRWLIKSSSGKPSRSANRARALDELSVSDGVHFR
jgi:fatty-acyl-CoA synthase